MVFNTCFPYKEVTNLHHFITNCLHCTMQSENILKVELDMPNRTTRDYEGPLVAPLVQAALDAALQEEEEITVDAWLVTCVWGGGGS